MLCSLSKPSSESSLWCLYLLHLLYLLTVSLHWQSLCAKGANVLQTKSLVVEEAATELIEMLLDLEEQEEEAVDEEKKDGNTLILLYTCIVGV